MKLNSSKTPVISGAPVVCIVCFAVLAVAPSAHATTVVGWIFADQPDAIAIYQPDLKYNFNSSNTQTVVQPKGKGLYYVGLPAIPGEGPSKDDVQISAYNTSGWCVAMGGNQGAYAKVQCYDAHGVPANAAFTLLYQYRNAPFGKADAGNAFAMTDQPSDTSTHVASTYSSFNSTGGSNTVKANDRPGATSRGFSNYTLSFPGLTKLIGNVQATSVGYRERCKVVNWSVVSGGATVNVQCYNYLGAPDRSIVDVAYSVGEPLGYLPGVGTFGGAFAYANDPTSTNVYTPLLNHQFNGFGTGHLTAQKTGTGLYTVTIPGALNYTSSTALVTATGTGNGYCNLAGWTNSAINVACYKQGGVPADSRFEVSFQTAKQS